MKSVLVTIFLLGVANTLSADVVAKKDAATRLIVEKEYKCTFPKSFLIGMCEEKQYFYVEEQSSIKRNELTNFYRFVEKSTGGETISDTCEDISSKKSTDTLIKCNDFGIVLMRDDRYIKNKD